MQLIDGYTNVGFVRDADGFGVFGMMGDRATTTAVSFAFDTGEIWSVNSYIINAMKPTTGPGPRPGMLCPEDRFKYAMHCFRVLLARLELRPPLRWIAGMEGIKGTGLFFCPPSGPLFSDVAPHGSAVADTVVETRNNE